MLNSDLLLSRMAKLNLSLTERKLKSLQNVRFFPFTGNEMGLSTVPISVKDSCVGNMFNEIPSSCVSAD